jgi:hypothetical protein
MLQAGRSQVRVPDKVDFFNLPNPFSRTVALGSTRPLTGMSITNLSGGKKGPARRADNLTAIYEPRRYTNLRASTACTGITTFFTVLIWQFFLFWYVETVPKICPHLSVTSCIRIWDKCDRNILICERGLIFVCARLDCLSRFLKDMSRSDN